MYIKGRKVTLRAIEKKDCSLICGMFNDPDIEDKVVGWAFPVSELSQEKWMEAHCNDNNNLRLVIETKEDGAVGIANIVNIDWKERRATFGIKLADPMKRSKGIGTDTLMAVMRYVFDELQFNRLDAGWFPDNVPSYTMFKKCGWIEEGVRRKYVYKKGRYRDMVLGGILAEEYYELVNANHYWD